MTAGRIEDDNEHAALVASQNEQDKDFAGAERNG